MKSVRGAGKKAAVQTAVADKRGKSALGRLLGPVPIPSFPAGTDSRDVGQAIGDAIVRSANLDSYNFFRVLEAEPSLWEQSDVVWALGFVKSKRVIPALVTALRSKNSHVRGAAANSLSHHQDASTVEPLIEALHDRSSNVRTAVIEALAKQRDRRAIEPLREALTRPSNQKSEPARKLIAETIAHLGKRSPDGR